ncbi:GAF domain-containing protein [Variovorax boronicumulans]|uniref:GAF domain-containing protein n=1 Tax=Variovorax boronicumulans TaxID=436515 RepID=UPI001C559B6B
MRVVVSLDAFGRWRWELHGPEGLHIAESCGTFATYSLAVLNADEVCRCIPDAPIEVEVLPSRIAAGPTTRMTEAFAQVCSALRKQGLDAALAVLNRPLAHRYSAVYWMPDAQRLVNVGFFDKQGDAVPSNLQTVAYNQSFCQFAIRDGQFRTENSSCDARLDGNIYQGVMNSYHAVPMVSMQGQVLGTICHFDTAARALADEDFELLRLVAEVFVHCLPKPSPAVAAVPPLAPTTGPGPG